MSEVAAYTRLAGVYDEIVVDPCYARWADFLDGLWASGQGSGGPTVTDVLDVCCGTGLMASELVARGYAVVGVDASAAMLSRARHLLGSDVPLQLAELPALGNVGTFDAAISNFDGLNYVDPEVFADSLRAIGQHLNDGGWLVFDIHTDAMMDFTLSNAVVSGESDGNTFVIRSRVDRQARVCETTINVTHAREGDPFTETHVQYFHSDEQVCLALAQAGFTEVRVVDEYTYRSADNETLRATWIARRGFGNDRP